MRKGILRVFEFNFVPLCCVPSYVAKWVVFVLASAQFRGCSQHNVFWLFADYDQLRRPNGPTSADKSQDKPSCKNYVARYGDSSYYQTQKNVFRNITRQGVKNAKSHISMQYTLQRACLLDVCGLLLQQAEA